MVKDRFNTPELRVELHKLGPLSTIRQIVERAAELYGDRIIISEKKDGVIISYTAKKIKDDVEALAAAMMDLGFNRSHVVIVGESSYGWVISYLATVCSGNVAVPMDKELSDDDIIKLSDKADVSAIVYSDTFAGTAKKAKEQSSKIKYTIGMYTELGGENDFSLQGLIKAGRPLLRGNDSPYKNFELDPDQMADIVFTSGTTGANKGVMLSHRNICTTVNGLTQITPIRPTTFSVLPISHTYEKNCNVLGSIYLGGNLQFNDSLKYLLSNMDLFKPHMSCMVPLLVETIYKSIWASSKKKGLDGYMRWGLRFSNALRAVGIDKRTKLFHPAISAFGGNFTFIICGGAYLRPEVAKGLAQMGIDIANGYGISECSPLVSYNGNILKDPYSVGTAFPGVTISIGEKDSDGNGEILVKGENVMLGYYNDPESTAASFDEDGWFKTGDFGCLDKKGRLVITGRKKNLIIMDNGKNVHPEEIETVLMDNVPYIKEVVVHAAEKEVRDQQQQVIAAEIFIDPVFREENAEVDLEKLLQEDINRVNKRLPVYKQIHCIGISPEEFQKTTSKKIQRHKVISNI